MSNIWAHDLAERFKMRRATQAKADGLTDYDVGTYPSEISIKKGAGVKGLLAMGLAGASLLGGGVMGGAYLADMLKSSKVVETITTETKLIDYDVDMQVTPPE